MFLFILAAALLPAALSAPLADCDALTRQVQIQGRDQFLGVWTYVAESTNMPGSKTLTKMFVDNVWGKIYPANESDSFFVFQVQKMLGRCFSVTSKLTLVNNTLHMDYPISATEVLMTTSCPDCILLLSNFTLGESTYMGMQLLTRRPKVTSAEIDEFKRQAACLNLPSPTMLDSDKGHIAETETVQISVAQRNDFDHETELQSGASEQGFCTDSSASKDSETVDLTSAISQADPEYMKILDKLLSSQSGIKMIMDSISN